MSEDCHDSNNGPLPTAQPVNAAPQRSLSEIVRSCCKTVPYSAYIEVNEAKLKAALGLKP